MIEHLLNSILPTIQGLGSLGYWFVALIFFAEAIVFVGLVIPGGIVALLLGALVAQGVFDLGALLFFATLGFCLGDTLSYSLGKRGSGFFKAKNRLLKEAHLEQGQAFFKKHGSRSVFLGRFIGVLRPLTPFLAGLTQMPFRRFFWLNLLSIVTWTYLHMIAGYFFGQTLWLVKLWTNRLELFLVLFVVVFAVFYSIKWFFIHKGESFWQAFNDLIKMQTRTLSHNPRLRKIALDYPRTLSWLHQRLTRKKFTGLPL
ncbi:DedA family protein, partial [Candidatus Falkowbacteria bacterium]|nr:DedA family protein [Candidatus Falkowbacteria bacterium]